MNNDMKCRTYKLYAIVSNNFCDVVIHIVKGKEEEEIIVLSKEFNPRLYTLHSGTKILKKIKNDLFERKKK